MSDTQWPRFQVFLQEKPGAPFQDVGSVHAPDLEMALFNARDVFVRRPACAGLRVAPANAIFSKTRQELETWLETSGEATADETGTNWPEKASDRPGNTAPETYYVFCKRKPANALTQVGEVEATGPEQALRLALKKFASQPAPFAWWVLPARLSLQNDPEDVPTLFEPADEKTFRMSTDFQTHSAMRKIRSRDHKP